MIHATHRLERAELGRVEKEAGGTSGDDDGDDELKGWCEVEEEDGEHGSQKHGTAACE